MFFQASKISHITLRMKTTSTNYTLEDIINFIPLENGSERETEDVYTWIYW